MALEGVGSEGRRSLNSQTYYNKLGLDFLPGQGMTKGSQEGVFLTLLLSKSKDLLSFLLLRCRCRSAFSALGELLQTDTYLFLLSSE